MPPAAWLRFYSLSRRAYSGTDGLRPFLWFGLFLFAVAKGVQRNARSRGLRADPPVGFYSLSRRAYSGTLTSLAFTVHGTPGFYSLSRRAYSGTPGVHRHPLVGSLFLFAVAKGVQRNMTASSVTTRASVSLYSLSRRAYSGTVRYPSRPHRHPLAFLFAVAKGVQRNGILNVPSQTAGTSVSIRCREGRTAEHVVWSVVHLSDWFLFAVAKGVQRNGIHMGVSLRL